MENYTNVSDLYKMILESVQNDMVIFESVYNSNVTELTYAKMLKEATSEEEKQSIREASDLEKAEAKAKILAATEDLLSAFDKKQTSVIKNVADKLYKFWAIKVDFAKKNKAAFLKADMSNYKEVEYYAINSLMVESRIKKMCYSFKSHLVATYNTSDEIAASYDIPDKYYEAIERAILDTTGHGDYSSFAKYKSDSELPKKKGNPFNDKIFDKETLLKCLELDNSKAIKDLKKDIDNYVKVAKKSLDNAKIGAASNKEIPDDKKDYYVKIANGYIKILRKFNEFVTMELAIEFDACEKSAKQELQLFKNAVKVGNKQKHDFNEAAFDLEVDELCEACTECFYGE